MPQGRNASAGKQRLSQAARETVAPGSPVDGESPTMMITSQAARETVAPGSLPSTSVVLSWMVRVGISLVLTTPLVIAPDVFYPFVIGKAVYARSIIELTLPAWVALVLFFPERRPSWSWTLFAFAVWLVVSWTAGVLGVSPTRSIWSTYERMQGLFELTHWFVFVLMAGSVFRSVGD